MKRLFNVYAFYIYDLFFSQLLDKDIRMQKKKIKKFTYPPPNMFYELLFFFFFLLFRKPQGPKSKPFPLIESQKPHHKHSRFTSRGFIIVFPFICVIHLFCLALNFVLELAVWLIKFHFHISKKFQSYLCM